ncbi:MAG: TonB-dependent receptor, partial [Acidobacteria bacterium]|nr:TonB-dependent receptor [Acidobacteriota bacterium]
MTGFSPRFRSALDRVAIATVALILGWPAAAPAFEGRVLGPAGNPLAGARISIGGRPGTILADARGRFTVEPDPVTPFVLLIARPDGVAYRPVTIVHLPEAGPLTVGAQPLGETVTVVSGSSPDLELPPAAAVTVIGRSDLEQRQPAHVAEAIQDVPGASASGVGPAAVPALRGLPKGRTLIILDHGRVTTERRAGPSASYLDPDTIDEVEVIRGPGSVAYGSDAFGGVIRIRSRMAAPGAGLGLRGGASWGSAGDERTVWGEGSGSALGGGLLAGVSWRTANDYASPDGTVPNTGFETKSGRLAWQREAGGGMLQLGWRTDLGRNIGKPNPSPLKRYVYPVENSHRLDLAWERPLFGAWKRLSLSATWDSYELILDKDKLREDGSLKKRSRSDTDARDYGLRVEAERSLGPARLILGLDVSGRFGLHAVNRSWTPDGTGALIPGGSEVSIDSARRDDLGLFAGLSGRAGPFLLSAGLRFDAVRSRNTGGYFGDTTITHAEPSGFAAAGLDLGRNVDLTVQLGRGFREATLSDRFYRGLTGRGTITGNPRLEPETSRQADLALRWHDGRVQLALNGYLYRIENLIERYKADGAYWFRNRGEAQLQGVELAVTVDVAKRMALQAGAWWERGEVRGAGDPVDDIPAPGMFVTLRRETSSG